MSRLKVGDRVSDADWKGIIVGHSPYRSDQFYVLYDNKITRYLVSSRFLTKIKSSPKKRIKITNWR